jgi:hypothetical protein
METLPLNTAGPLVANANEDHRITGHGFSTNCSACNSALRGFCICNQPVENVVEHLSEREARNTLPLPYLNFNEKAEGSNADAVGSGSRQYGSPGPGADSATKATRSGQTQERDYWTPSTRKRPSEGASVSLGDDLASSIEEESRARIRGQLADEHNLTPEVIDAIVTGWYDKVRSATLTRERS